MTGNKSGEWQKLKWATKVQLCEQGRANENSLLHSYIVIFVSLEAMLFASVITRGWGQWWSVGIAILGIGLAFLWAHLFELRGNRIDHWEAILDGLWKKIDESELEALEVRGFYKGAVERRKRRKERGRMALFLGWGSIWERLMSARWVLITLIPSILVLVWVILIAMSLDC